MKYTCFIIDEKGKKLLTEIKFKKEDLESRETCIYSFLDLQIKTAIEEFEQPKLKMENKNDNQD